MRPGPDAAGGQRGAAALRAVLLGLVLAAGGLAHAGEEAAEADGGPLAGGAELEARWIERVGDRVEGEGDVRARFGEDRATAERFTLDLDRGVLVLWEGTWSRPAGQARFAHESRHPAGPAVLVGEDSEAAGFRLAFGLLDVT